MTLVLPLTLVLAAGSPDPERLLLCRPVVRGEPGLARADGVLEAARGLGSRFLDYGVACEGEAEAIRAARRAGLALAVSSTAEGHTDGSRFVLTLSSAAEERPLARRELSVAPGADAVPPLRLSLEQLLAAAPAPPRSHLAPWAVAGAGAALLAAGGSFALVARSNADARERAAERADYRAYVDKDASWRRWRSASRVTLGAGAAALAVGLAWRLAF